MNENSDGLIIAVVIIIIALFCSILKSTDEDYMLRKRVKALEISNEEHSNHTKRN